MKLPGFPRWLTGKESACQCRRCGFDPWVPWRRKWQPIPVFLPGKSRGQRSLVGYNPWGHKKPDTSQRLNNNNIGINKSQSCYKALQYDSCSQKWVYPECLMWLCEPFHIAVLITEQHSMQPSHHHLCGHIFTVGVWLAVPKAFLLFWSPLK